MHLSTTEENYIKIIYRISRIDSPGTLAQEVSTNQIADLTNTKPASVSDMLKNSLRKN